MSKAKSSKAVVVFKGKHAGKTKKTYDHANLMMKLRLLQSELSGSWQNVTHSDSKTPVANPHRSVFSGLRGGNDTISVKIAAPYYELISGANAASSTVRSLLPNASADAISLSLVYDECRTLGFTVHVRFDDTTTATAVPAGPTVLADAMVAYDPANPGAYTGVDGALDAQYRSGPHALRTGASPSGYGPDYHKMTVKIPTRVVDPAYTTALVGSNWTVAVDTAPIVGYLKPYMEAQGAGTSCVMQQYVIYDMEFRART